MTRLSLLLSAVLMFASWSMAEPVWVPIDDPAPTPPTTKALSNSDAGTVLDVTIHGFWRDTCRVGDTVWDVISIPECTPADLDTGKPEVPCISHALGIPDNAQVMFSVETLESTVFDSILCYPYQGSHLEDSPHPFVLDSAFYDSSVSYPALSGEVTSSGKWRTLSVAGIKTYPVNYAPAARLLSVSSHYRVNITYAGGAYSHVPIQPWVSALFAGHLANFSSLDLPVLETGDRGVECLVLCHENWAGSPGLHALIKWDSLRGIKTKFVADVWTVQTVKQAIQGEYNSHYPSPPTLRWVLLVGPPLGGAPGHESPIPMHQWGTQDYEVGDYWYSDLKPEGNPDGYPEVGIARLAPQNADDLNNQCWRILNYEKSPPTGSEAWTTRMLLVSGCGDEHYRPAIDRVYNWSYRFFRYDIRRIYGDEQNGGHGNSMLQGVFGDPAQSPGIVGYRGHGEFSCWFNWASPGTWSGNQISGCDFGARTPVVCSFCCNNGEANPNNSNLNLSRKWMSGGNVLRTTGAVASLAATRGSRQDPNDRMCLMMARSVGDRRSVPPLVDPTFDIGGIKQNIDADLTKYRGGNHPEYYDENREMYYFLGYPTMPVWSGGTPEDPVVTYPPLVPDGTYEYRLPVSVKTADGRPVEDALVCAWKKNPPVTGPTEFYAAASTNFAGNATLWINPLTAGQFSITASTGHARNGPQASPHTPIKPSQGLTSLAGGHANIVCKSSAIDDAYYGNGNGAIEPGERIRMTVSVKNEGTVYAPGAFGVLRYFDPDPNKHYVSFDDQQVDFDDLLAGASCSPGCDYFVFTVSNDCPLGYSIPFWLEFHDQPGNICGNSYFNYPVSAGLPPDAGPSATFPTQARHLVRRPNSNELHIVYQKPDPFGIDSIWYQRSTDGGVLWSRDALAQGQTPCISLDFNNLPWVTYTRNDSLFGSFMDICGQWHEFLIYYYEDAQLGPASFVCSNLRTSTGITPAPDMGYAVFTARAQGAQTVTYSIKLVGFDPAYANSSGQHNYFVASVHGGGNLVDTMPCLAKTPGDYLHIVWHLGEPESGEQYIMYTTPDAVTTPWAIRTGSYPSFNGSPVPLASGDALNSPFADAFGLDVFATWADDLPWQLEGCADVWRAQKQLTGVWQPGERWSQPNALPSDYPAMSAGALVWANDGDEEYDFDVRARWSLTDPPATVHSGGEYPQAFLHADYQMYENVARGVLRTLFTEMTPSCHYAVRLAQYVNIPTGPDAPFYSVDIGDSVPSPFCLYRDGVKQYDNFAVDYADSALEYQLLYLNPMYHYRARLVLYHEDPVECTENTTLDDSISQAVAVPPLMPETLWLELPQELYCDGSATLSIEKLTGTSAVLAGLEVFQYEDTSQAGSGGAQSANVATPRLAPSLQSASLFAERVRIFYSLSSDARVSLRVFDLSGRVVRVLQDARTGMVHAGRYSAEWDGRDNVGRLMPTGVYFCGLEAQDTRVSRKLVLMR
jgi:hypothetical protein